MKNCFCRQTASIVLGLGFALTGCASTEIKSSWKDPAFSFTEIRKALVMAAVPQSTSQRIMEDAFVKNLKDHHVEAIASYTLSPAEAKLEEEGWKRLIAENHVDTVLVARLIDVKTIEREVPPTTTMVNTHMPSYPVNAQGYPVSTNTGFISPGSNNNWYGYYMNSYQMVTTPGYVIKDEVAVAETKVYHASADKLIWSGSTQTLLGPNQDTGALMRQFAKVITDAIYK